MMTELSMREEQAENRGILTLAELILIALLLLGATLRLVHLGELPLSETEASQSLAVYSLWHHGTVSVIGSPAYLAFSTLFAPFFGDGDGAMRVVPALFGIATLFLPWLLRQKLGQGGALIATALLAASPLVRIVGFSADGDSIAIFAALLLLVAWWRGDEETRPIWQYTAVIALALGLASSPLFYSFLFVIGVIWIGQRLLGPRLNFEWSVPSRSLLIVGGIALIAISSTALFVPQGIGAAAQLAAEFVSHFGFNGTWHRPILALLLYEPILTILGVISIIGAAWRGNRFEMSLIYGVIGVLLLTIVQSGVMTNGVILVILLVLLAGKFFGEELNHLNPRVGLGIAIVVGWGMIALVNIGRYSRLSADQAFPLIITLFFFFVMSIAIGALTREGHELKAIISLGFLALSLFYATGMGWRLTHFTANDPRELWSAEGGTDSDIVSLARTLRDSSFHLVGSDLEMKIITTIDSPIMRWYLRDFTNVSYAVSIPVGTQADAVIVPKTENPQLEGKYAAATYDYKQLPTPVEGLKITDLLRWWFFRTHPTPIIREQITIWQRLR